MSNTSLALRVYLLLRKTQGSFVWPAILFHLAQTANISETQMKTKVEFFKTQHSFNLYLWHSFSFFFEIALVWHLFLMWHLRSLKMEFLKVTLFLIEFWIDKSILPQLLNNLDKITQTLNLSHLFSIFTILIKQISKKFLTSYVQSKTQIWSVKVYFSSSAAMELKSVWRHRPNRTYCIT